MQKLEFDYDYGNKNGYPEAIVSSEIREKVENYSNNIYAKYAKKINDENGKVLIKYSMDGKEITGYLVECKEQLHKEIYSDEEIIEKLSENKKFILE